MYSALQLVIVLMLLFSLSSQDDDQTQSNFNHFNWWAKRETENASLEIHDDAEDLQKILDTRSNADYSYSECAGPLSWPKEYPSCDGDNQSPINVNLHATFPLGRDYNLIFKGHDTLPNKMLLKNTGKTVVIKGVWRRGRRPTLRGGLLDGSYVFHEIHFHWGATNFEPGGHLINGYSFPLEMHLVHYKRKYGSLKNAKDYKDGIATVAYVFQVGNDKNPTLQRIIDNLPSIQNNTGTSIEVTPFKISKLTPIFIRDFAAYQGSLTMPPCSEIVTWFVYLKPIEASCDQVEQFRHIWDGNGNLIKRNFRPTQRLNSRKVVMVSRYRFH